MNSIDWKIVAEIFTPLIPQLQWPTLTTLILFGLLDYHGYLKYLKKMRFLFLPSSVGAWVAGLFMFLTNTSFVSVWMVVSWLVLETILSKPRVQRV